MAAWPASSCVPYLTENMRSTSTRWAFAILFPAPPSNSVVRHPPAPYRASPSRIAPNRRWSPSQHAVEPGSDSYRNVLSCMALSDIL